MKKENIKKAEDEMFELYKTNKINELIKIKNDKNETAERRIAADFIIHMPADPRRIFKI